MQAIQIISQDLFDKIRSRFTNLEMGDETGAVTIDPVDARFFDFDFVLEGNNLGRVSISLNDLGSLKVYYSQGITENQDDPTKKLWYKFLKEMRFFAMRRLLRFDTRDISKTNLDKNDFQHLATTQPPKEEPDMTTMNESRWNNKSTKKTSRAVAGRTEVIVRHAHPVDEAYAGSRSQKKNIKAIFIQNQDGERFKYPFIHPAGAFAMAQHVDHGGIPHDPAGKAIIRMSEEIAQLGEFQRKVHSATLHDDATGITERAIGRMNELKSQVAALSKRHHYESWMAEFSEMESGNDIMELDDVTMEEYKQKFTQTNFQEELASYFPLLHKIMREANIVDLEEYVSEDDNGAYADGSSIKTPGAEDWKQQYQQAVMAVKNAKTQQEYEAASDRAGSIKDLLASKGIQVDPVLGQQGAEEGIHTGASLQRFRDNPRFNQNEPAKDDPPFEPDTKSNFSKPNNPNRTGMDSARALAQRGMSPAESINAFEEWADATEQGKLTDDQIQELKTAIEQLPMGAEGPELELGSDGQTAIQFFQGLGLDDSELEEKLKDMANVDPTTDALQVLKLWADEQYPELSVALGISGAGQEPAAAPDAAPAEPAPAAPPEVAPEEQPTAENDDMSMHKGTMEGGNKKSEMIKTIAERVKSFYNRDNPDVGPFRGEQNIATEIKKECAEKWGDQAGEQAHQMAEMFMEKLTNEWNHKHGKVNHGDGLSINRLKELVGNIKAKVESMEEDGPKPSEVPAWKRKEQGKAPLTTQDLEKERDQSRTTQPGLDAHSAKIGVGQKHQHESAELESIMKLAGLAK